MTLEILIAGRHVGAARASLVIAEIGINHEGNKDKTHRMIDAAAAAGCECVKFQPHIVDDEMVGNDALSARSSRCVAETAKAFS